MAHSMARPRRPRADAATPGPTKWLSASARSRCMACIRLEIRSSLTLARCVSMSPAGGARGARRPLSSNLFQSIRRSCQDRARALDGNERMRLFRRRRRLRGGALEIPRKLPDHIALRIAPRPHIRRGIETPALQRQAFVRARLQLRQPPLQSRLFIQAEDRPARRGSRASSALHPSRHRRSPGRTRRARHSSHRRRRQ